MCWVQYVLVSVLKFNLDVFLQPVLQAVTPSGPGLIQTPQIQPTKAESPTSQQLLSHNHLVQVSCITK